MDRGAVPDARRPGLCNRRARPAALRRRVSLFGINVVTIGYYQSIERGRLATGLTVLRGIVLMAFCFLVLPRLAGVAGIWLAVPAAELAVTLLLLVLLRIGYGMRR